MKTSDIRSLSSAKNLSSQDFLDVGVHKIAYIKPVQVEDKTAYAIHAADGTPLSVLDTLDHALFVVQDNDLEVSSLQ